MSVSKCNIYILYFRGMCVCVHVKGNLTHPEAVDQVVSGEQLVHQELQRVLAASLVKREDIEWPLINVLQTRQNSFTHTFTVYSAAGCVLALDYSIQAGL